MILFTVKSSQDKGCRHQLGEFLKVTPSNSTFLLLTILNSTGRNHGRISAHSSSVLIPSGTLKSLQAIAPFSEPAVGYHISCFSSRTPPEFTSFFHCEAVSFPFFYRTPAVTVSVKCTMSGDSYISALRAEIGDWQRRVSSPSKEVAMIGYASKSPVKSTSAFCSVYRFTLLNSSIGPVNQTPSGIITLPPPRWFTSLIASLIAWYSGTGRLLWPRISQCLLRKQGKPVAVLSAFQKVNSGKERHWLSFLLQQSRFVYIPMR